MCFLFCWIKLNELSWSLIRMAVGQILMCLPSKSLFPDAAQISCFSIDEAKHLKIFLLLLSTYLNLFQNNIHVLLSRIKNTCIYLYIYKKREHEWYDVMSGFCNLGITCRPSQGCTLKKIEGSPVLWTCEIQCAQHMISMKKLRFSSHPRTKS